MPGDIYFTGNLEGEEGIFLIRYVLFKKGGVIRVQYLVCYDIPERKIRSQVAKYLESLGRRIQYSVFICEGNEVAIYQVKKQLLVLTGDSVKPLLLLLPICRACEEHFWMIGEALEKKEICIVA